MRLPQVSPSPFCLHICNRLTDETELRGTTIGCHHRFASMAPPTTKSVIRNRLTIKTVGVFFSFFGILNLDVKYDLDLGILF
jgi:hypothetical protein